ncbi:MAG: hypothetical protein GF346_03590 [Candidatus Eisenbacteria bacterium]|nr:hypothetical protein [Candidatus Latescibacterota bacterium]MBD3301506.1 hypothetical protein [Candidatus Eisenbacteria bacterium]
MRGSPVALSILTPFAVILPTLNGAVPAFEAQSERSGGGGDPAPGIAGLARPVRAHGVPVA